MKQQKTVCNRENRSRSDLWGRQCWIADSVLSLVQSRAEYLFQQNASKFSNADTDPDSPLWALLADLDYYIEELRVQNGLREPAVLNRDEEWPSEITTPPAPSEPGIEEQKQLLNAPCVCGHLRSDHAFGYRCNVAIGLTVDAFVHCDCERFTPPAAEPGAERSENY